MRVSRVSWALTFACGLLAACSAKSSDNADGQGGGGAGGGSGGTAGVGGEAGAAGAAGAGGAAGDDGGSDAGVDLCQGVPVTGTCIDANTISACVIPSDVAASPKVITGACIPGTTCGTGSDGIAKCVSTGQCNAGESYCPTANSLSTCDSTGNWATTSCGTDPCKQKPGYGAVCAPAAGGSTVATLHGFLTYDWRDMNATKDGLTDPTQQPAQGLVVVVYDGNTYIGSGYTAAGGDPSLQPGEFSIPLDTAPTANTNAYFFPMYFNDQGQIMYAVAKWGPKATSNDEPDADSYYSVGYPTGGQTELGTINVADNPADGAAAAINIFEYMLFGLQNAKGQLPSAPQQSVIALFTYGEQHVCGGSACFMSNGASGGGVNVPYTGGADHFETAVAVPGTTESMKMWLPAVLLHELGHYMMNNYSRSPGVGGPHTLSDIESPALAWSEGYATFHGQSVLGTGLYFSESSGTYWWMDIDKFSTDGGQVPVPSMSAPMDQEIGEVFVSSAMWHLWSSPTLGSETEAWDTTSIGDQAVWTAFASDHLTKNYSSRGFNTPDLVDWLDGVQCGGVSYSDIKVVTDHFGFPYDGQPTCP